MKSSAFAMSSMAQSSMATFIRPLPQHNERIKYTNRNKAQYTNAWAYISDRFLEAIHKTFRKEQKFDEFELMLNDACAQRLQQQYGPQSQLRRSKKELELLCKKTNFTKNEIKLLYWGWKCACPNGILNESTFKDIYSQFFPQAGDANLYAHHVFNAMFSDVANKNNGQIAFSDYASALSLLCRGTFIDKLRWMFNLYDINKDGHITLDEMIEISIAIYALLGCNVMPAHNVKTCEEHANKIFAKLDLQKNGFITFDQFMEACIKDDNIVKSMQLLDGFQ